VARDAAPGAGEDLLRVRPADYQADQVLDRPDLLQPLRFTSCWKLPDLHQHDVAQPEAGAAG
jgi:hypothetical protein